MDTGYEVAAFKFRSALFVIRWDLEPLSAPRRCLQKPGLMMLAPYENSWQSSDKAPFFYEKMLTCLTTFF